MTTARTIIHIGAGRGRELEHYLSTPAESIFLVEPQPELTGQLQQAADGTHGRVSVVEAAITGAQSPQTLKRFNFADVSSLYEPTDLLKLLPGLQQESELNVRTMTLAELLIQIALPDDRSAMLVIDAPGAEWDILACFLETPEGNPFSEIQVISPELAQYSSGSSAEDVIRLLENNGYDSGAPDRTDPDWPCWRFRYNRLYGELLRAQEDNQDLRTRVETLSARVADMEEAVRNDAQKAEETKKRLNEEKQKGQEKDARIEAYKQLHADLELLQQDNQHLHNLLETMSAHMADVEATRRSETEKARETEKHLNDEKKKSERKEARIAELESSARELSEEQSAHKETREKLKNYQQWLASGKDEIRQLKTELESAHTRIAELKTNEDRLEQSRKDQTRQLSGLEDRLEHLFKQQSGELQETANALGRHVTRSVGQQRQQLESVLGLQGYFETGETPLSFGDWAISADLATRLVDTIEQNDFDLIIEFGSGTSTVLFAKAIANSTGSQGVTSGPNRPEITHGDSEYTADASSNHQAMPHSILSFEQDSSHLQETRGQLQQHGLETLVDLVHAPLVPTQQHTSGETDASVALFYDCDHKLSQFAQRFEGRRAKILVLVDGPYNPQSVAPARAPALRALLQHLAGHQLHCVLDDTLRESERQAGEAWASLCREAGLPMHQTSWHTRNGAIYFIVNPD